MKKMGFAVGLMVVGAMMLTTSLASAQYIYSSLPFAPKNAPKFSGNCDIPAQDVYGNPLYDPYTQLRKQDTVAVTCEGTAATLGRITNTYPGTIFVEKKTDSFMLPIMGGIEEQWTHTGMIQDATYVTHNAGSITKAGGTGSAGSVHILTNGAYGEAWLNQGSLGDNLYGIYSLTDGLRTAPSMWEPDPEWGGWNFTAGSIIMRIPISTTSGTNAINTMNSYKSRYAAGNTGTKYRFHSFLNQTFNWTRNTVPYGNTCSGTASEAIGLSASNSTYTYNYAAYKITNASNMLWTMSRDAAVHQVFAEGSSCTPSGTADALGRGIADQVLNCFFVGDTKTTVKNSCPKSVRPEWGTYNWGIWQAERARIGGTARGLSSTVLLKNITDYKYASALEVTPTLSPNTWGPVLSNCTDGYGYTWKASSGVCYLN